MRMASAASGGSLTSRVLVWVIYQGVLVSGIGKIAPLRQLPWMRQAPAWRADTAPSRRQPRERRFDPFNVCHDLRHVMVTAVARSPHSHRTSSRAGDTRDIGDGQRMTSEHTMLVVSRRAIEIKLAEGVDKTLMLKKLFAKGPLAITWLGGNGRRVTMGIEAPRELTILQVDKGD